MTTHRPYVPITPLASDDPARVGAPELRSLSRIWARNRQRILDGAVLERLRREWAIETGLVEGLYRFDRGVTETLIVEGISVATLMRSARIGEAEASDAVALMEAQARVVEGLFAFVKAETPLTEAWIRELHRELTTPQASHSAHRPDGSVIHVRLEHGRYKQQPNNVTTRSGVVHDYCPPVDVPQQMQALIEWHRELEAEGDALHPEVHAAWLHHRFAQIHPFADGNGRVARALASLVFLRRGLLPMMIRRDGRSPYFDALEAADDGDLLPLVRLVGQRQKEDILLVLSSDTERDPETALEAAARILERRDESEHTRAQRLVRRLEAAADRFFRTQHALIDPRLMRASPAGRLYQSASQFIDDAHPSAHLHDARIAALARTFHYEPDPARFAAYYRFWISDGEHTELVVHLHALAGRGHAVRTCSAFALLGAPSSLPADAYLAAVGDTPFEFDDESDEYEIEHRFRAWLEPIFVQWMNLWASLHGASTLPEPDSDGEP